MPGTFCGLSPMLFGRKLVQGQKAPLPRKENSCQSSACNFILIMELRKKIIAFRDIIDLPPPSSTLVSTDQLLIGTMKDLHKFYPESIPYFRISEFKKLPLDKALIYFCKALQGLGDTSKMSDEWINKYKYDIHDNDNCKNVDKLVEIAVATLNGLIKIAKEKFDMMDEDDENKEFGPKAKTFGKVLKESYSEYGSSSPSPVTPTSVLPELMNGSPKSSYSSSLLLPLRVQAVGKSNPVDVKRLGSDMLPKVQVHVQNSLNQKKVAAVEKQAKGNSPVRKTSEVPHLNSSNANGDKAKSSLNVALPSSPLGRLHSELLKDKVGAEKSTLPSPSPQSASLLPSPSPSASASPLPSPSASQLSSPLSTSLLPSPSPPASQLSSPLSTSLLPSPSPSASPLPSPSPSPLSETPSAEVLLPSPQSQRVKMSMDMETDIRLLPPPPKPSAEVLLARLPSLPTKLSTDKAVDIRAFAPSAPPTAASALAPPLLQQNVVSGGPPLPSPPMLQRNVEAVQATKVATESQLPSPLSMLTNITVAGIPLPRPPSPPPPVSSKPNVIAIGAPLPPPPPVLLQSKVVATGAPLPPPPPPPPGTVSTMPPPQPPMILSKGSGPFLPPPPSPPMSNEGAAPPPPPHGAAKSLRPKKVNTKLKRSSHIGSLYRVWRGKIEECPMQGKSPSGTKTGVGTIIINGKQGISDALAEMNKRSVYFQQIEEDVDKHAKSITELKTAVNTFNTKDMTKLLKFHKHVESILENLTDETQVLTRFEGFPTKKLEALRTASGIYLKLESMITVLQNWKIEPPLADLLNKVDRYFNKIKGEIVALERTKDELNKKFKSQDIDFDFQILVQIKEAMVDVSSNCMELAMKERREVKLRENEVSKAKAEAQRKVCIKMLWRAFQLAFRVYTFAGLSHDDRADQLTPELADESQIDAQ
ncbi:hypothetical protein J1N35_039365 [Gossypium stocksii]|uniref:Uncharacterized protein n=1 Tax=Gossypium stocksii TaxID=47602 RepID=A0A9D3UNI6_9ROSI|nr:hypothetical protein J1N35_039365 [Gossypium stocksii]